MINRNLPCSLPTGHHSQEDYHLLLRQQMHSELRTFRIPIQPRANVSLNEMHENESVRVQSFSKSMPKFEPDIFVVIHLVLPRVEPSFQQSGDFEFRTF